MPHGMVVSGEESCRSLAADTGELDTFGERNSHIKSPVTVDGEGILGFTALFRDTCTLEGGDAGTFGVLESRGLGN